MFYREDIIERVFSWLLEAWITTMKNKLSCIFLLLLLSCILIYSLSASAANRVYSDLSGHWGEAAVMRMQARGVVNGYPDATFRPERNVSRAEFTVMLIIAVGRNFEAEQLQDYPSPYTDVKKSSWMNGYINEAYELAFFDNLFGGSFQPDKTITRGEASAILVRSYHMYSGDWKTRPIYLPFSDAEKINGTIAGYVSEASACKLISGYKDGSFRPAQGISRAEAIVMLDNLLKLWGARYDFAGVVSSAYKSGRNIPLTAGNVGQNIKIDRNCTIVLDGEIDDDAWPEAGDYLQGIYDGRGRLTYLEIARNSP